MLADLFKVKSNSISSRRRRKSSLIVDLWINLRTYFFPIISTELVNQDTGSLSSNRNNPALWRLRIARAIDLANEDPWKG